jgi:DNA polymerase epsilon subunit 3
MPPRKSDQRKSDVSTARFSLIEELGEERVEAPAQPAATPTAETPAKAEKDKDKEKAEKAEKEKDKSKDHRDAVTIEDLTLPKSIIARLAKGALPANTQIQANAMLALNRSATVVINYLASHANEHTLNANRKTISPEDVYKALADVDMAFMKEQLEREFEVFTSIQTEKRSTYRQKVRAAKQAPGEPSAAGDDTDMADASLHDTTIASEASGPRSAKKARVEPSAAGATTAGAASAGPEDAEDADTEDEPEMDDDDDEDDDEVEEEDEDEQEAEASGDELRDPLEDRERRLEQDEAVDDDDSD